MRKWIDIVGITLCAGACLAGPETVQLYLGAVPTNATANVAAAASTNGNTTIADVLGVYLDLGGYASPTVDVDIVAINGVGFERTILSMDGVTADGAYYPREIADTTAGVEISNEPVEIPLHDDTLVLRAYDANVTNTITLKSLIYIRK